MMKRLHCDIQQKSYRRDSKASDKYKWLVIHEYVEHEEYTDYVEYVDKPKIRKRKGVNKS